MSLLVHTLINQCVVNLPSNLGLLPLCLVCNVALAHKLGYYYGGTNKGIIEEECVWVEGLPRID